jgi:hypothetical protein
VRALTLDQVHTGAIVIALLALALAAWRARAVASAVGRYFFEPTSALNLGLLRVMIFWKLVEATRDDYVASYAAMPASMRRLPYGWQWSSDLLPFDPAIASGAETACLVASWLAVLGVFSRASAFVAALLSVYVLGLPNFFLKINHGYHAIVLMALILGVSACGDAFSVDRLWKRFRGHRPPELGRQYTIPVRLCWLILGTVYLFPGLWKLWQSGDLWLNGTKLKAELFTKWVQLEDFEPLYRIDEVPWLLAVLGAATILFEIAFIFALFNRYTRVIAAFSAVSFHWGTRVMMNIGYHPTLPLILLFDFPGLPKLIEAHAPALATRARELAARIAARAQTIAAPLRLRAPTRPFPGRSAYPALAVGSVLVAAQLYSGFTGIDTWPIAVHPRFSGRNVKTPTTVKKTVVKLVQPNGQARDLAAELAHLGNPRLVRLTRSLRSANRNAKALDQRGREMIELFRDSGVKVAPGDRIVLLEQRWSLFPVGERANLKERTKGSYLVTPEYSLAALPSGSKKKRTKDR